MQKSTTHTTHTVSVPPLLDTLVAKLRAVFEKLIPIGYQDDAGFHYGVQKAAK